MANRSKTVCVLGGCGSLLLWALVILLDDPGEPAKRWPSLSPNAASRSPGQLAARPPFNQTSAREGPAPRAGQGTPNGGVLRRGARSLRRGRRFHAPATPMGKATLRGRVVLDSQAPAGRGLVVTARKPDQPFFQRRVSTRARGRFVIEGLAPGRYVLAAQGRGLTTPGSGVPASATRRGSKQVVIAVHRGQTLDLTVSDRSSGSSLPKAVVRLRNAQERVNALVTAGLEGAPTWSSGDAARPTDATGRTRITGLAAGEYTLAVSHPGHVTTERKVVVKAGGPGQLHVALEPSGGLKIRLTRRDGSPWVRVLLLLTQPKQNLETADALAHKRFSDALGRCRFTDLAPGRYRLWVVWWVGGTRRSRLLGSVTIAAGVWNTARYQVPKSEQRPVPGSTHSESRAAGVVSGRVLDAQGLGTRASVGLWALTRQGTTRVAATTTDARGRFRLAGLAAGTYRLSSSGPAGVRLGPALRLASGQRAHQDQALEAGGTLHLTVLRSDGSFPAGARVLSHHLGLQASNPKPGKPVTIRVRTLDEHGRVRLAGLIPGEYRIRVLSHMGQLEAKVKVVSGQVVRRSLVLEATRISSERHAAQTRPSSRRTR